MVVHLCVSLQRECVTWPSADARLCAWLVLGMCSLWAPRDNLELRVAVHWSSSGSVMGTQGSCVSRVGWLCV